MRVVKMIPCRRCGVSFKKRTCAVYCDPCKKPAAIERAKLYVEAHRAEVRVIKTRWRLANPEKQIASDARWKAANAERVRAYRRAGKKRRPVANRSYVQARKARIRNASVVRFTPTQLDQRLSMYGGRCWMCGAPGTTTDHVKPIARGGAHMLANLRPACLSCNSSKGDRWPIAS